MIHILPFRMDFKPKLSTVLCSLILEGNIKQYLQHGSYVYSCLPDASKAFDRVHYGKLFNVLIKKTSAFFYNSIPFLNSYIRQQISVLWNNCTSMYFTVFNGVKQRGVLSPTLFSIYIDRLLKVLRISAGAPNSAKFRGGCRGPAKIRQRGGLQYLFLFYVLKMSLFRVFTLID